MQSQQYPPSTSASIDRNHSVSAISEPCRKAFAHVHHANTRSGSRGSHCPKHLAAGVKSPPYRHHAVQISPVGDAKHSKELKGKDHFWHRHKRHNFIADFLNRFTQLRVFSGIRSCFCRYKKAHATQPDQAAASVGARNRRITLL